MHEKVLEKDSTSWVIIISLTEYAKLKSQQRPKQTASGGRDE